MPIVAHFADEVHADIGTGVQLGVLLAQTIHFGTGLLRDGGIAHTRRSKGGSFTQFGHDFGGSGFGYVSCH